MFKAFGKGDGKAQTTARTNSAEAANAVTAQALRQSLHEQALRQLVGQRLILAYLGSQKRASTETDIDLYVDQLRSRLEQQNVEWGPFLEDLGVTETEFRTSVRWKLSWENYLAEHLTEKNLQRFFEQNQGDFDGTEIEVSQILFKIKPTDDEKQVEQLVVRMKELKAKIESNSVTFVEAARSDSEAASGPEGGSLGRIKRNGTMPESFSKAAFALAAGEISDPVTTNIGVHLIRCDEVIKGDLQFEQVRDAVRRSATQYLFDWLVEKAKENHSVKYVSRADDSNEK